MTISRSNRPPHQRVKVRDGEQYLFRFPPGLKSKMLDKANEHGRSLAAEMITAIERHLEGFTVLESLEKRISNIEQRLHIS